MQNAKDVVKQLREEIFAEITFVFIRLCNFNKTSRCTMQIVFNTECYFDEDGFLINTIECVRATHCILSASHCSRAMKQNKRRNTSTTETKVKHLIALL